MKNNCPGNSEYKEFHPEYCFGVSEPKGGRYPNLVGCRQMGLAISVYQGIYRCGRWLNLRGDYMYNKKRMIQWIKESEKTYLDCPYMMAEIARDFVCEWPDIVNPNIDETYEIYPPTIGELAGKAIDMGLRLSGPAPTAYGEEFPVITNANFFLELIDDIYGKNIDQGIQNGLLLSYQEISEQILHYFD